MMVILVTWYFVSRFRMTGSDDRLFTVSTGDASMGSQHEKTISRKKDG